jgi:hypothetical protein
MFSKSTLTPEAKTEKRKRFWRKARRRLFWTVAIAFVIHSTLNIYASIQLNREYAYIRQKGDPIQFSEMKPPAIPDAENAAFFYLRASKALKLTSAEGVAFGARRSDLTTKDREIMAAALRKNSSALIMARKAALMPKCQFTIDWSGNPSAIQFDYYAKLRELSRLLAVKAQLEAQNGEKEEALQDVRAGLGITQHLTQEPILIGILVAMATDAIAHRGMAHVLEDVKMTVPETRAFQDSLPQSEWISAYRHCLVGERAVGIYIFENLGKTPGAAQDMLSLGREENSIGMNRWAYLALFWLYRPILKLDEVQSLRLWKKLLDTPTSQQFPTPTNFGATIDASINNAPKYALLTRILFPVFARVCQNRDRGNTQQHLQEVALAITCYRTIHGKYPAKLADAAALWGKPLPLDPYSQKPFKYSLEDNSFRLYSIGVNQKDDGGLSRSTPGVFNRSGFDDIVWLNSIGEKPVKPGSQMPPQ